jgi:hypothetical protein
MPWARAQKLGYASNLKGFMEGPGSDTSTLKFPLLFLHILDIVVSFCDWFIKLTVVKNLRSHFRSMQCQNDYICREVTDYC